MAYSSYKSGKGGAGCIIPESGDMSRPGSSGMKVRAHAPEDSKAMPRRTGPGGGSSRYGGGQASRKGVKSKSYRGK